MPRGTKIPEELRHQIFIAAETEKLVYQRLAERFGVSRTSAFRIHQQGLAERKAATGEGAAPPEVPL
jgi:hypothetical protein